MSFKALFNRVSNKIENIVDNVPELAGDLQNTIDRTASIFKGEALNSVGVTVAGLSSGNLKDGNLFASMDPKKFKSNLDAKPGPIGYTTKVGTLVPGESQPPWPNELEDFASMNTIITLACLSHEQINDPDNTYRKTGLTNIVCQSGGGAGSRKNKTQVEIALGNNVEFFIDNFEISVNAVPSLAYGFNSNVTKLTFDVLEPYSMGLFWQALTIAAAKAGFVDYTTACFALQIDFKGWDVDGNQVEVPYARRFFPIKLTNSTFSVNEGGSTYMVEAIAWNERALSDSVQQVKTDIAIKGRTVKEILQSGAQSVTAVMNSRLLDMQEANQVNVADQFVIIFPNDRASTAGATANEATNNTATISPGYGADEGFVNPDPVTGGAVSGAGLENFWQSQGGQGEVPQNFDEYLNTMSGNVKQASGLDFAIKKYAASNFSNNEIGKAKMLDSPFEGGTQPMPDPAYVRGTTLDAYAAQVQQNQADNVAREKAAQQAKTEEFEKRYAIFSRTNKNMRLDGGIRTYTFTAGTRLQEIIEEVLLTSMYGRELATQLDDVKTEGAMIKWYKVETDEYVVPNNSEIGRTGKVPTVHVYRIVPYLVHHSVFKAPTTASQGIPELKAQAAKQYNYIYTGKNKDILNFEIAYNNSFIYPVTADKGSSTAAQTTGAAGTQTALPKEAVLVTNDAQGSLAAGESAQTQTEAVNTASGNAGGSGVDNSEIGIARMFNDRLLNSRVDMVTVNMTIMGDPFYLADDGVGNFHGKETPYTNMMEDGQANFSNGELHINILFRTPVDINADKGDYTFPEELIVVDTFSGLYRVNTVVHSISGNQYTTRLQMNRLQGQDSQSQTQNLGALIKTDKPSEAMNEKAVAYAQKVSDAAIVTGATENLEAYKKEVAGLLGGYQGLDEIVRTQASSLGLPALDAFGNIGASLAKIQSQIGIADLGKIGAEFNNLKNAATSFASETLSQINLSGTDVLGKFGTNLTGNIGNNALLQNVSSSAVGQTVANVKAQIPNAVEQAASANVEKLAQLNTTLTNNKGPR